MNHEPQNVFDYYGSDAVFLVWNFNGNVEIKDAFKRVCVLVINLNNSGDFRFPDSGKSCVLGIGYNAWHLLDLPGLPAKE